MSYPKTDPYQRLMKKVIKDENGCWLAPIPKSSNGYSQISHGRGKTILGHRAAWEAVNGAIPEGKQLDHLCRVRNCVNPDHLEVVSAKENVLRGVGISAQNSRKTQCKRGHEFTEENTFYKHPKKGGVQRLCRECERARWAVANEKSKFERHLKKVCRLEVIDHTEPTPFDTERGRVYTKWDETIKVELSLQDDDRTLKIFITDRV